MIIKTYIDSFQPSKRQELKDAIATIKNRMSLKRFAPIYITNHLISRKQVYRFHKTFDCFVSTTRGEGWGVPQMEAMLLGKPIISTNIGGIHEHLEDGTNAYLIPHTLIPLRANSRNQQWYLPDQNWADIDGEKLRAALRFVFKNQDKAKELGALSKALVLQKFSLPAVGQLMKDRLEKIVPLDNHNTIT